MSRLFPLPLPSFSSEPLVSASQVAQAAANMGPFDFSEMTSDDLRTIAVSAARALTGDPAASPEDEVLEDRLLETLAAPFQHALFLALFLREFPGRPAATADVYWALEEIGSHSSIYATLLHCDPFEVTVRRQELWDAFVFCAGDLSRPASGLAQMFSECADARAWTLRPSHRQMHEFFAARAEAFASDPSSDGGYLSHELFLAPFDVSWANDELEENGAALSNALSVLV